MSKRDYQRYLQSAAWQATRERRLDVSGHQCEFRPLLDWNPKHGGRYEARDVWRLVLSMSIIAITGASARSGMRIWEVLCRFHHLVRHATRTECVYCGEIIEIDDKTADEIVADVVSCQIDSIP